SSPEKRAALQRYADGDRRGAMAVLDSLTRAENGARTQAAAIANAAELRKLAQLAEDMKDKGELHTQELIARYKEVTQLDPGVVWDWLSLTGLYQEAGRLDQAQATCAKAVELAETTVKQNPSSAQAKRDASLSYSKLGDVAVEAGDLADARRKYEQS